MRWTLLGLLLVGAASGLLAAMMGNHGVFVLHAAGTGAAAGAVAGLLLALLRSRRLRTAWLVVAGALVGLVGPVAIYMVYQDAPDHGGLATGALIVVAVVVGFGLAMTALVHALTARVPEATQQRVMLIVGLAMAAAAGVWVVATRP